MVRPVGGRAYVRSMRIPASVIVGQFPRGATPEDILRGYPDLERGDNQQAPAYRESF